MKYLSLIWTVARRECKILYVNRIYFFSMVVFPLLTMVFFTTLMNDGLPQDMPVGVVDLDNTSTSRSLVQKLDGLQNSQVVAHYPSVAAARHAIQENEIYGFLYIPKGMTDQLLSARRPKVSYYYSQVSISGGSMVMKDLKTITTLGSAGVGMATLSAKGMPPQQIQAFLQPIKIDLHQVANPWGSYNVYLSTVFVPGVMMLFMFLISAYSLGMELKFGRGKEWLAKADNNIVVAILGKFLPQALIFLTLIFFYEYYIYCVLDFPHQGGLWKITRLALLEVFSSIGFGVFIFGLMPSLRMSMSICSLWAMLGFSMAGSAFPMMGMDEPLQSLTWLFPLRHYYMLYQITVFNGFPLLDAWFHFVALVAFMLSPWFVIYKIKNAMLTYVYMIRDEGVLLFCLVVPLLYPMLYSWIYNNEVVHEVPVAVVDLSHSHQSRQFIRMCDASPDVRIAYYAVDLDDAQSLVSRQVVKGIYFIPEDFATHLNRLEQGTISVYCDMALMLTYKAIYQTAMAVSQEMGAEIQKKLAGNYTVREDLITTSPLEVTDVAIFNPQGGYGSSVLPAVLILIIQQTLVLGIGLAAGTARERSRYSDLVPIHRCYSSVMRVICGKALCYLMVYAVMGTFLILVVPRIFHFPQLAAWQDLLAMMIPYLLSCVFFGMTVSCLVHYRENVMLLVVFLSLPLLFLSGISWPQSAIPGYWQGVSWLFPCTFGIRAYTRLNSMGATLGDVVFEVRCLWALVVFYLFMAYLVYGFEMRLSRRHSKERMAVLQKKRQVRSVLKEKIKNPEA